MTKRTLTIPTRVQVGFCSLMMPIASLTAFSTQAAAEQDYFRWDDMYRPSAVVREAPKPRRIRSSVLPPGSEKAEKVAASESRKPQGPLVIAISIQRQQMKIYDSQGLFAESPISSGMPGHATPMGVFSVIQKNKFHRSNIYSGAPMPYMQRITWSGVAMHAGVLPGYPASHGCIRLPMSFAMKLWGWTRMGARVVVTPGEISPADFAHPSLAGLVPPAPVAALPEAPARPNIQTADASGSLAQVAPQVMTDITTGGIVGVREVPTDVAMVVNTAGAEAFSELPAPVTPPADAPSGSESAAAEPQEPTVPVTEAEPQESAAATAISSTPVEAPSVSPADVSISVHAEVQITPPVAAPVEVAAPQPAAAPEANPIEAPVAAHVPLIKPNAPVAIFVSRKDAKIYVRQNFKPVFEAPITIAPADKALGTHVFTARNGGDGGKALQWSVVSLPAVARQAAQVKEDRKGRRNAPGVEVAQLAPSSPAEALERLSLPADLMSQLGEALPSGSSLVVSDQGIAQGETGEGTDFIVRLR